MLITTELFDISIYVGPSMSDIHDVVLVRYYNYYIAQWSTDVICIQNPPNTCDLVPNMLS